MRIPVRKRLDEWEYTQLQLLQSLLATTRINGNDLYYGCPVSLMSRNQLMRVVRDMGIQHQAEIESLSQANERLVSYL